MNIVIGIGEYVITEGKNDKLKTFALASCIAVTAYSPLRKVGGMVHVALPSPTGSDMKHGPGYFASTGVPLMINSLCNDFGCHKGELMISIYGGADSINRNDIFNIGKRNIEAVNDIISKMNLKIHKSEVGGYQSRTIEMNTASGNVSVSLQPITI